MSFWLVIILTLVVQEGISTIAVLLRAEQLHYSLWAIHILWLVIASLEIAIAYRVGKLVQKSFADSKFERWVKTHVRNFEASIDKRGENVGLLLLSLIISPFVAAFLASWLDISFTNIFFFTLLGDGLWYASEWATVVGAQALLAQAKLVGLVILVVAGLAFTAFKYSRKKSSLL
jgi:hypothetical protein